MNDRIRAVAIVVSLVVTGQALAGDDGCCQTDRRHLLERFRPVGGWQPYGGGIFHWWTPHCFPRSHGPDDYCRKPIPNVCRPSYPPNYEDRAGKSLQAGSPHADRGW
jgi:hypothetical protein